MNGLLQKADRASSETTTQSSERVSDDDCGGRQIRGRSITALPIASIFVGPRLRPLREKHLHYLSESIEQAGLQHPIAVARASNCGDEFQFVLVAGLHRLQACQKLGWIEIPAIQLELGAPERELWEVDEKLCRVELTLLERAEHLVKRKEIYERLHPETQQHVAGARAANASMKRGHATANFATASFADDTSEKTGIASRTIRQATRRAKKITEDVRNRIRPNLLICDNGTELDTLASLSPSDQERAVDLVQREECRSIKDAKRLLGLTPATRLSSAENSNPPADRPGLQQIADQQHELITLLVSAALRTEPIPEVRKIADLLRCCGFGNFADQVSRGIEFENSPN